MGLVLFPITITKVDKYFSELVPYPVPSAARGALLLEGGTRG
jgi:hypothetical protein